ncbi:MAG: CdaR family protein [Victivallaceae bacterium]|nr:CdaR family protein [Victivallaceae bacterium]MDD4181862.1 CdaR family protein [Victivallaceae bacterium]
MPATRPHSYFRDLWNRLLRAIRNDFWRKMIAIACAILVYFAISYQRDNNDSIRVPVEVIVPQNYVNMSPKQYVNLRLSGNRFFLRDSNRLSRLKVVVRIPELAGAHNIDEYPVKIDPSNIEGLPRFGVSANSIEPASLSLKLDQRITKELKIVANYNQDGELPSEYMVVKVTMEPDTVKVSGPESKLKDVQSISTEKIPLSGVNDNFEYQVDLRKREFITFEQNSVRALVTISRQYENRLMKAVTVRVLTLPGKNSKVELATPYVDVTLRGAKDKLGMLKNSSICPYIDISSFEKSGVYSAEVFYTVDDPSSISVKEIYPSRIQITITTPTSN